MAPLQLRYTAEELGTSSPEGSRSDTSKHAQQRGDSRVTDSGARAATVARLVAADGISAPQMATDEGIESEVHPAEKQEKQYRLHGRERVPVTPVRRCKRRTGAKVKRLTVSRLSSIWSRFISTIPIPRPCCMPHLLRVASMHSPTRPGEEGDVVRRHAPMDPVDSDRHSAAPARPTRGRLRSATSLLTNPMEQVRVEFELSFSKVLPRKPNRSGAACKSVESRCRFRSCTSSHRGVEQEKGRGTRREGGRPEAGTFELDPRGS